MVARPVPAEGRYGQRAPGGVVDGQRGQLSVLQHAHHPLHAQEPLGAPAQHHMPAFLGMPASTLCIVFAVT